MHKLHSIGTFLVLKALHSSANGVWVCGHHDHINLYLRTSLTDPCYEMPPFIFSFFISLSRNEVKRTLQRMILFEFLDKEPSL